MKNKKRQGIIIGMVFILAPLSATLYLPAMPLLTQLFHTSAHAMLSTLMYFFVGYAVGQLFWGPLSDRIGRRPVLLTALVLYVFDALMMPHARSVLSFSLLYAFMGFLSAPYTGVSNAVLKDIYREKTRQVIGYIGIVLASGPFIGQFLGGHLLHYFDWQGVFVFLTIYAVVCAVLLFLFIPEPHTKSARLEIKYVPLLSAAKSILKNRCFLSYVLILGLAFGSQFALLDVAPFIFKQHLHLGVLAYSWIFSACIVSGVIGAIITSRLTKKRSSTYIIKLGLLIIAIGAIAFTVVVSLPNQQVLPVSIALFIIYLGFAMTVPACKGGAMSSVEKYNGIAGGMMKLIQSILTVSMIALAGLLYSNVSLFRFALMLIVVCVLIAMIFFYQLRGSENRRKKCLQ